MPEAAAEILLTHRCPRFRTSFNGSGACERMQARAKALADKGQKWLGALEHCRECRGTELEVIMPEGIEAKFPPASQSSPSRGGEKEVHGTEPSAQVDQGKIVAGGEFCSRHPEERQIVIEKEGPRQGQVMGACRKCLEERKLGRKKGTGARGQGPGVRERQGEGEAAGRKEEIRSTGRRPMLPEHPAPEHPCPGAPRPGAPRRSTGWKTWATAKPLPQPSRSRAA